MTIGQRIKNRREELQMSQDELAKKIGYKSRSSINKIESDLYNLKQSKIKDIADVLLTTPSYIMGWTENCELTHNKQEKLLDQIKEVYGSTACNLISKFSLLDDVDQAKILERIEMLLENEKYSIQKESSKGKAI